MRKRGASWRISGVPIALCLAVFFLSASGCASRISTKIASPFGEGMAGREGESRHVTAVLREIEQRNKETENTPEWIQKAYQEFMIRKLSSVGEEDYSKYAAFLDNGSVYIIVHPAYYTFFHDDDLFLDPPPTELSGRSAMDSFLAESAYSSKSRLVRAQEKQIRDFLEYASTDGKLVILLLPREYRRFPAYKFKNGKDEYMRFINEVTNGSDSVLYLYSRSPNRGTLGDKDRRLLFKFLFAIKAREILLGGGYVGRCVEDFYKSSEQYYSDEKIYLVPEITAISPADISSGAASDMLRDDGTIDIVKLSASLRANVVGNQGIVPRIKNLPPPGSTAPNSPYVSGHR